MLKPSLTTLALIACGAVLGGCGKSERAQVTPDTDPALIGALADPLMVDTDLSSQNRAAAAIADGGPPMIELPVAERTPEAVGAARDEARKLAGGSLKSAPLAGEADGALPAGVTAAQLAASVPGVSAECAGKAEYAMSWSLSLPASLAIYPHGHLQEAAGTDRDGCRLRAASFVTPVDASDVIDFYYTRLSQAGYGAKHRVADEVHVLDGNKGRSVYAVRAARLNNGLTRVDLISNGS